MSIKKLSTKLERLQREVRKFAAAKAISKENKKTTIGRYKKATSKDKSNYDFIIIRTL